jgi:acetyltransferase-like isoleucine patch superfamily enzyme
MSSGPEYTVLLAPREGVNDDVVRVVEWLVREGDRARARQPVVTLETTKASFDVEAPTDGFVFPLVVVGAEVLVGSALALISEVPQRPHHEAPARPSTEKPLAGEQVITRKARAVMEEHGLSPHELAGLPVVRASDVEQFLSRRAATQALSASERTSASEGTSSTHPHFRDELLDPAADWDAILRSPECVQLRELLTGLRKRLRAKFNRHVPTGSLLYDRWDLAKDYRFGEGTSVYDECLILGDVRLGKHCWVGPYTILDASRAPLTVGDYVDIGAGAHLYTHNTIERALTGHQAPLFAKATTIGNCCFIAPQSVIAPGTVLGDHCFVAVGSYVEGKFPPYSYIAGNPARQVGVVAVSGNRARVRRFHGGEQAPSSEV